MKEKRSFNKTFAVIMVFATIFASLSNGLVWNAKAAISSKELASTYLNTTVKYLNFGQKDSITFDFNINKEAQKKGAAYTWYIKEDKGDQGTVTINSKNGVVTAKKAGTAYIRCKISLADGTILRPEAKVIVRNNITAVDISNMPGNQILYVDEVMDFNRSILNTDAGKGKVSKGITRWELKYDTAGIGNITEDGVVTPTKVGAFSIRAVCFQSKEKYSLHLKDKETDQNYITAASKWYTITVEASRATVTTQEQLDKALGAENITQITISTEKELKFIIAEDDYLNKTLIVDAPNADIDNYARFKDIIIRAIKENTWNEYAVGNTIQVTSIKVRIIVNGNAEIKEIIFDRQDSIINLIIEGTVHKITILQPSELNLSGDAKQIPITIEKTGSTSKITTSIPLNLECNENSEIVLNPGSEGSTISKSDSKVEIKVENNSEQSVVITTGNTGRETVNAGETGVSNGTAQPTVTPIPQVSLNSITIKIPATKTVYLVGETLDITGLLINAIYSNGSKDEKLVTEGMISGFNSSATAIQTLTITLNGKTATYTVEIKPVPVDDISVSPTTMTLTAGGATGIILPTITPSNAEKQAVTWSSSDETIATVDNGVVTPVASGTTTITAESVDGNKTATCEVTVNLLDFSSVNINVLTGNINGTTVFMEYSNDSTNGIDGVWSNCTASNTSVTFIEGLVYVRAKAEPGNFKVVSLLTAPAAPTLVYDDVANIITGLDNTYEYNIDAGVWTSGEITGDFTGTKAVEVRLKATPGTLPSQIQTINFTTNLVLTGVGINIVAGNITGTTSLMQYSLNSTTGTDGFWTDCSADKTPVTFIEGQVYVRAKIQPGNIRLVTTIATPEGAPTLTFDDVANIMPDLDNTYEYMIDPGAWTFGDNTTFFNGGIVVKVRLKATTDKLPSQIQTITFTANLVLTGVGIDVAVGIITGTTTLMQYSVNSTNGIDGTWAVCNEGSTAVTFVEGKVYVRANAQPLNYRFVTTVAVPAAPISGVTYSIAAETVTGLGGTYEYSINGGAWSTTAIGVTFTEGPVTVREKVTASALPSIVETVGTIAVPTTAPILAFDDVANSIPSLDNTYEYIIDSGACTVGNSTASFGGGIAVKVRLKATNDKLPSQIQTINFTANLVLTGVGINVAIGNITGTTTLMQYSLNSVNGTDGTWLDCSTVNTVVTFNVGKVFVRAKAQTGNFLQVATVAVPAAPTSGVTYSVVAGTVTGLSGTYEYSINGGAWSTTATAVVFVAGPVMVRTKVTASALPSVAEMIGAITVPAAPVSGVTYSVSAGTVTGLLGTYEYSINGGDWSTSATAVTFVAGSVRVRTKVTGSALPSVAETVGTVSVPAVPISGVTYSVIAETVTGLGAIYEYNINGNWSATSTGAIFIVGPVTVRKKATATSLPSLVETVGTIAAPASAPALAFNDVANSIPALDNTYEYMIDSGAWTLGDNTVIFSGGVVVKVRKKATTDKLPSQSQTINFTANLDLTGVGINIGAGSITGTTTQMQYSLNSTNGTDGTWTNCSAGSTTVIFVAGPVHVRANAQPLNYRIVDTVSFITVSVTGVSSSSSDGYYMAGSTIAINVTFDGNVTVVGVPSLNLETGISDRLASYSSGSGTAVLTFNYIVQAGDVSSDLDYTATNALILNGGTIRAKGTAFNANLTIPTPGTAGSLGYTNNIIIDNTAPTAINISATNIIPGSGNVTLTSFEGPLSTASWNNILNLIKTNTALSGNWITGITADKLTITPSADGSTATLNNTNTTAATIVKDFIIPAPLVVDKAGNIAAGDIRINSCNSSVTSIAITNSSIVYSINNGTPDLYVAYAKTAGQLKNSITGLDESPQTYTITDSVDSPKNDASILLLGDKLIVTSESGLNQKIFPIRVAPEPITTIQLKAGAPYASSITIDNTRKLYITSKVSGMTVGNLRSGLIATDSSNQTYAVTDGVNIVDDGAALSSTLQLIVTAYDGVKKSAYEIRCEMTTVTIGNITVIEGDLENVNAIFTLIRLGPSTSSITLSYYTEYIYEFEVIQADDEDYIPISGGTITFASGEVTKTITVQILGGTIKEPDEQFQLIVVDEAFPGVFVLIKKRCTIIDNE